MVYNKIVKWKSFLCSFFVGIFIALLANFAKADILFEGYYKIILNNTHIGFSIQRYSFDAKKKQFSVATFLKTNENGGNQTESLTALSSEDLKPISYQFTTMDGKKVKTIDASFAKEKLTAIIKDSGKVEKFNKPLPKGTFLSSFLAYVMLKGPKGLKSETKYDYSAIPEEDAVVEKGSATVSAKEDYAGIGAFKITNQFKNQKWITYVSEHGDVLEARAPAVGIASMLVAKPSEATQGFAFPTEVVKATFGDIPTGQINDLARKVNSTSDTTEKNSPKKAK